MTTENFEDSLKNMTKTEVPELKHEIMLSKIIKKAKAISTVSFWWLCIPLYVIAAFIMKSYYTPNASLIKILHEFTDSKGYTEVLLFFILPILLIVINLLSIKQLYFVYSDLTKARFLKMSFAQISIILLSLIVLLIYLL